MASEKLYRNTLSRFILLTVQIIRTAFITKYNIKTNYLEYYKVVSTLKLFSKQCFPDQNLTTLEEAAENLFSSEKVCKKIYHIIVKTKTSSPVKSQGKRFTEDIFSNVQVRKH